MGLRLPHIVKLSSELEDELIENIAIRTYAAQPAIQVAKRCIASNRIKGCSSPGTSLAATYNPQAAVLLKVSGSQRGRIAATANAY